MEQQALKVIIMGQQNNFDHILAATIRHWGHEAVELPLEVVLYGGEPEGDVLLYDLDESWRVARVLAGRDMPSLSLETTSGPLENAWEGRWSRAGFIIALSSRSVSRATLERIGAVALLQKPFGVERLQRYLSILQRLLLEERALPPAPCDEKIRVLVVDDDVEIAHTVRQCLAEEADYDVVVAYDGLEALEHYLDWRPHCIVTDLIMPWMSGYQVIRCLDRSPLKTMPAFVVMSALTRLEVPVNRPYLENKVVVYVDKPFHIEHLLTAIEQALHKAA
ncbi:MAG: response regulator [Ktedonobacteraceae bacterium]|nr:response regulator [Chloroflexota bacterium]